jgi:putative NADPH-quinone reductase
MLRSQEAWEKGELPAALQQEQPDIFWAEHFVLFFPLWLGDMTAVLKAFLGQVVSNFKHDESAHWLDKLHQLGRRGN